MKILLTNDDGYNSEGLIVLAKKLSEKHDILILAPDSECSGYSHSLSLRDPMKIKEIDKNIYSCSGNPADCVVIAKCGFLDFNPDIVISGINRGCNLGTDLIYSGTAAAARQAAILDIPGIAVSLESKTDQFRYSSLASTVCDNLDAIVSLCSKDVFININANDKDDENNYQFKFADPCVRSYTDSIKILKGPGNYSYCFYEQGKAITQKCSNSDAQVIKEGFASISLVKIQPEALNPEKTIGEFLNETK